MGCQSPCYALEPLPISTNYPFIIVLLFLGLTISLQILSSFFVVVVDGLHPANCFRLAVDEDSEPRHLAHQVCLAEHISISEPLAFVAGEPDFIELEHVIEGLGPFVHGSVLGIDLFVLGQRWGTL